MYSLHIGHSKSRNYAKAVEIALAMGGVMKGDTVVIDFKEPMGAYRRLFPLFRLRVMTWKNTRAYHNGKPIHPYRFALGQEFKKQKNYHAVMKAAEPALGKFFVVSETPFLYYKREKNRFWFKNQEMDFYLDFTGKDLYDFVDEFNVGDIVFLEHEY